ncbi:hypothetical protein HOP50_04g28900 [Chloropicon primus]|uniref:Uncharacterized protein n=1 Tax=Chloropicon primus TaxID=1764295 RepID=A0A5B8MIU2_9CHLO|nr:hypothetical protein A3770_04p28910 [Chloropicon primus]UPQ99582.1 hypothetical protein HOP50_04g28900 [Chloropicon primus]|eukprot:QDZ20373.1 hypothetical protein A3770_04p28910 [Chloropicon primus]
MTMGTTYHRTPMKGGKDSTKKPNCAGKSTAKRLKNGKGKSKALTKSSLATELFKSPTATPVKTPKREGAGGRRSKSTEKARKAIDFMEYLEEGMILSPKQKQVVFASNKVTELRTKKQTKSARRKSLKRSKFSGTPKKRATTSRLNMAPRTPAKEPKPQEPLKSSRKDQAENQPQGLLRLFAIITPVITLALAGTRKLALRGA